MVEDNNTEKIESLGEFLLRQRKKKKLDLEDILVETRIPPKTLLAMEADDYEKLPADAFARGFYILYSNFLGLDTKDILERYTLERGNMPRFNNSPPPLKQDKRVNTMAARPPMAAGFVLGSSMVLLIIVFAALCWHFSWNPATFLSEKLRDLQPPVITETQQGSETVDSSINIQKTTKLPADVKYLLRVDFLTDTTVTISVDDSFPENEIYTKDSSQSWQAKEAITLIFPESARVILFLNGSQISLPKPEGGFISLSLP